MPLLIKQRQTRRDTTPITEITRYRRMLDPQRRTAVSCRAGVGPRDIAGLEGWPAPVCLRPGWRRIGVLNPVDHGGLIAPLRKPRRDPAMQLRVGWYD
jgi:hypothetical protein